MIFDNDSYFIINTFLTYYDEKVVRDTFIEFEFKENNQTIYAKFISKIELYSDKYKFEAHFTPKGQDGKLSVLVFLLYSKKNRKSLTSYMLETSSIRLDALMPQLWTSSLLALLIRSRANRAQHAKFCECSF
jgi:hypothetical protein